MRSRDNDTGKKPPVDNAIPDFGSAAKGLNGVKAPAGYKQTDDIMDRLKAAGVKPMAFVVNNKN